MAMNHLKLKGQSWIVLLMRNITKNNEWDSRTSILTNRRWQRSVIKIYGNTQNGGVEEKWKKLKANFNQSKKHFFQFAALEKKGKTNVKNQAA